MHLFTTNNFSWHTANSTAVFNTVTHRVGRCMGSRRATGYLQRLPVVPHTFLTSESTC